MGLFPVREFGWIEPEAYRKEQDREIAVFWKRLWWLRPLCIFVLASLGALVGWMNKMLLHKDSPAGSPWGIWMLLGGGFFLFYGIPWILRRLPASVALYSNGIMKTGDQNIHPFKGMNGYVWTQKDSYYVLLITSNKGRILSYGVPDPVTRSKIDDVLHQSGVTESSC